MDSSFFFLSILVHERTTSLDKVIVNDRSYNVAYPEQNQEIVNTTPIWLWYMIFVTVFMGFLNQDSSRLGVQHLYYGTLC